MHRFWTADMHLGHSNILGYCGRPFKDCHHMNCRLIDEANMRVKQGDMGVHVGDFCVRGGQKSRDWLPRLHGQWTFVRGNHDKNNGVKTICDWMFTRIGHYKVFVCHIPYYYTNPDGTAKYLVTPELVTAVESMCDFSLCGHVHEKWKVSKEGRIPCYNVGVDVWNYRPVQDAEIMQLHEKEKKS